MDFDAIFPRGRVAIVGVLNLTPDSFSDGGRFVRTGTSTSAHAGQTSVDVAAAVKAAEALIEAGAGIVDLGGESTRPGAAEIPPDIEIARTAPVVESLARRVDVPLSIDTRKADVARAALAAGAVLVNDVSGLGHDPSLAEVVAERGAGLVLGHLRGTPETMQRSPRFDDVLAEVGEELELSVERALAAGVPRSRLAVDPGLGFGKRHEDNLALIANVGVLRDRLRLPVWLGPSRKSFLGRITGDVVETRDEATRAVCAVAAFAGADAVRVHDPAGAARAVAVGLALRGARRDAPAPGTPA